MDYIGFMYLMLAVIVGIASFGHADFWVALSGTLAPVLAFFGGGGMRGSLYDSTGSQKLAGIGMGLLFLIMASIWVSYTGYWIQIYSMGIGGEVWVLIGFLFGFIFTTKKTALGTEKL